MKHALLTRWPVAAVAGALLVILTCTLWYYEGNPSALFHIDKTITDEYELPEHVVTLNFIGYDGMHYYQMARNMPKLAQPTHWNELKDIPPGPYAHQRILLPVLAYLLSFEQEGFLPYTFLLINSLALLGTAWLVVETRKRSSHLFAIALALSPAAMVGLHFSLAEPLTLFLATAFLFRFTKNEKIDALNIVLLSLMVLSREVNILFAGATGLYLLFRMRIKDALLLFIPALVFFGHHFFIYQVFGEIPFLWSAEKNAPPLYAILELLVGIKGYDKYTLSSIALFLGFVLPAVILTVLHIVKTRKVEYVPSMLLTFLIVMLLMPDHIWGSITSIGRVITPVYPLYAFFALEKETRMTKLVGIAMLLLGLGAAFGLAFIHHPYMVT